MLHRAPKTPSPTPGGADPGPVTAIVVVAQPLPTAAAAPQPGQHHWWSGVVTVVAVAGHRVAAMSVIHLPSHHSVHHRSYPRRFSYLDNACLSREMRHL